MVVSVVGCEPVVVGGSVVVGGAQGTQVPSLWSKYSFWEQL